MNNDKDVSSAPATGRTTPNPVAETARKLYGAFEGHDRATVEALLADDFAFSSPRDDRIDKAEYFRRCWPNSDKLEHFVLEKVFVEGNEVFVRYRARRKADGVEFRNVEYMRIDGGRVHEVDVYFGRDLPK